MVCCCVVSGLQMYDVSLQAFIQRVEQRKLLLDLAVSFYTHTKEVAHTHLQDRNKLWTALSL